MLVDPIEKLENEGTVGFYSPEDGELVRIYKKDGIFLLHIVKEIVEQITRERAYQVISRLSPHTIQE